MIRLIRSPLGRLLRSLGVLAYTARSGRRVELVVSLVGVEDGWLVAVGHHHDKTWWRAFRSPLAAGLRVAGSDRDVEGRMLAGAERSLAVNRYVGASRSRRSAVTDTTPLIHLRRLA